MCLCRATDDHTRVAVPYEHGSALEGGQLRGDVLNMLVERDVRGKTTLVCAKSTKRRRNYSVILPPQQWGQPIPRTAGLPCSVYQNECRQWVQSSTSEKVCVELICRPGSTLLVRVENVVCPNAATCSLFLYVDLGSSLKLNPGIANWNVC